MEDIGRPIILVPIEAGSNEMLLFIGYEKIHFYDFANRRLVGEVPFLPSDNHVINSAHCQYV